MNEPEVKNFAIIGAAGYIAPKHLRAIKDTGNNLVAAVDPKDSVGILDSFFNNVEFFKEFESFDRYAERLKREDQGREIHYVSICSPNYLHDSHIFSALRLGANIICEKPLVLRSDDLDYLSMLEKETGQRRIHTILQLRIHPALVELKRRIESEPRSRKYDVDLTYITPRGKWFLVSWKSDPEKSGGLAMNIGVHFFDLLIWLFGGVLDSKVFFSNNTKKSGYLELQNAHVRWYLSTDKQDLPTHIQTDNSAYRSLTLDGQEIEFSGGFGNLHTEVYKRTLAGDGFGIEDTAPSIRLVEEINRAVISTGSLDFMHPMLLNQFKFPERKIEVKSEVLKVETQVVEQNPTEITKGQNVYIGENVTFGKNVKIGNNVCIHNDSIIGADVTIHDNAVIGKDPMAAANSATTHIENALPPAQIGDGCTIGTGTVIYRGSTLGEKVFVADTAQVRENVSIGEKTIIGRNVTIENKVTIGKFCKLQTNVSIVPYSTIEDYVFISPGVVTSNDNYVARTEKRFNEFKGVTLKRGARLGVGSVILPGITVYEDGLVGGGAVVTRDVPARKIVIGCPAYIFRDVPEDQLLENQKNFVSMPKQPEQVSVDHIPYIDIKQQYKSVEAEVSTAVNDVLTSGTYVMGNKVKEFEEHMSEYIGRKCLGVASGSDALLLALMALGVKEDDEVITTPFTFFATAGAIARLKAKPVFVDIDKSTFTLDTSLIEGAITYKTKVILPVHLFGNPANMKEINEIAARHGLRVIEDACQAIGAEFSGTKTGALSDFGAFSFFPTKNLGGAGDGGLISCENEEKYALIKKLRVHGAEVKYIHDMIGINSRLDPIQAAILDVKLKHLDEWNQRRIEIAQMYNEEFRSIVQIPVIQAQSKHVYHQYPIVVQQRDELQAKLKEKGIECGVYYPVPLHLQKCFEYLGYHAGDMPVAENLSKNILSLPIFPEMTDAQVKHVIENVKNLIVQ